MVYPEIAISRTWKNWKFGYTAFIEFRYTPQLHGTFAGFLLDFRQTHMNSAVHHGHCGSCQVKKPQTSALALTLSPTLSILTLSLF
jgi:hypothetical protein